MKNSAAVGGRGCGIVSCCGGGWRSGPPGEKSAAALGLFFDYGRVVDFGGAVKERHFVMLIS